MPGSIPPTSQLDWLISTTVMIVLSWSRAARDLLNACPGAGRGRSAGASGAPSVLYAATMVPFPCRLPHSISSLEGDGFEQSVPLGPTLPRTCAAADQGQCDQQAPCYGSAPSSG